MRRRPAPSAPPVPPASPRGRRAGAARRTNNARRLPDPGTAGARSAATDPRTRILEAALEEFASIGYAAARVDAIAERAGVNKAMLYYHVGGKQQIYTVVLAETFDAVLAALQQAVDPRATPAEKLKTVVATLARLGSERSAFVPMMLREVASGGANLPDEMVVRMGSVFRFVAGILDEGVRSGAFRAVDPLRTHVTLVGSTMFCLASQEMQQRVARISGLPPRRFDPAELAAHVGSLFLEGLRAAPPPGGRGTRRRRS